MASTSLNSIKERSLLAVIGDEDTVTGMLLAGVGQVDRTKLKSNFLLVDSKTSQQTISDTFKEYTTQRRDIGILLINQHVANGIRDLVDEHQQAGETFPVVLEIPSKEHPYNASQDSVMKRIRQLVGRD